MAFATLCASIALRQRAFKTGLPCLRLLCPHQAHSSYLLFGPGITGRPIGTGPGSNPELPPPEVELDTTELQGIAGVSDGLTNEIYVAMLQASSPARPRCSTVPVPQRKAMVNSLIFSAGWLPLRPGSRQQAHSGAVPRTGRRSRQLRTSEHDRRVC
jgi:hypothetical protein